MVLNVRFLFLFLLHFFFMFVFGNIYFVILSVNLHNLQMNFHYVSFIIINNKNKCDIFFINYITGYKNWNFLIFNDRCI